MITNLQQILGTKSTQLIYQELKWHGENTLGTKNANQPKLIKQILHQFMHIFPSHFVHVILPLANWRNLDFPFFMILYHQQDLDAVVGDVTIVAHRSKYVDFTLQYYESGVTMIVPFKDKKYKNAWVFLKPLTWDLWVTSACFFVFIGFVIWILEHQINEDFGGPRLQQVGNSFWFSFSTIVFAHSNLSSFSLISKVLAASK